MVIGLVILIIAGGSISTYNSLNVLDQNIKGQWSQVENVMQRRADVINNEVEVVKGYVKHEEKIFGDIAEARSVLYNSGSDIQSKLDADDRINSATRGLLAIAENYPDLKASQQFTNLQEQIEGSENRVSVERKRFIDATMEYNKKVTGFPGSIFAKILGFDEKEYFQASPDAQKSPEIKF